MQDEHVRRCYPFESGKSEASFKLNNVKKFVQILIMAPLIPGAYPYFGADPVRFWYSIPFLVRVSLTLGISQCKALGFFTPKRSVVSNEDSVA